MKAYIFILLYGSTSLLGIFLAVFWAKVAWERHRSISSPWYKDRYYIIAASVALITIGSVLELGARTVGNIEYGLSPILEGPVGYFIAIGLLITLIGFFGMVWLSDLETNPPKWTWLRRMAILTVVWAIFAIYFVRFIPVGNL